LTCSPALLISSDGKETVPFFIAKLHREAEIMVLRTGVWLIAAVLLAGCSSNPSAPTADVTGTVELDGAPLSSGKVVFDPGGGSVPASLDISGGNFSGKVSVGKKTVRISSFKQGTQKATGPGAEQAGLENIIPAKYNIESKETVEVTAAGPNQFKFKVTSK